MKRTKEATEIAAEYPDPPDGWTPSDFRDPRGPWALGLVEIKTDAADDSGPRKGFAIDRRFAWAVDLVGSSIRNWRRQLADAQLHRQTVQYRIGSLERQGRDTAEACGELDSAGRHIARLEALITAAEAWPGPDNATLRDQRDAAIRTYEDLAARIAPYHANRLPAPDGWEEDLFAAEKAAVATSAAFDVGRARLDALSAQLTKATADAYQALAGALAHVEDRLGAACAKIIHEGDVDFWVAFPNRSPDDLLPLHGRAERVNAIMAGLGAAHDAGMARFWFACGDPAREIVAARVGVGYSVPVRTVRPRGPHPDAAMNQVY